MTRLHDAKDVRKTLGFGCRSERIYLIEAGQPSLRVLNARMRKGVFEVLVATRGTVDWQPVTEGQAVWETS